MSLPDHKTKIVATLGPASETQERLEELIEAGMDVARLNFSHGDFSAHAATLRRLRDAQARVRKPVTVMADLPGPKMRLGGLEPDPLHVVANERFTLTAEQGTGHPHRAPMNFSRLPHVVKPGDRIFLNDGWVQLVVDRVVGEDVECVVAVGGELRSHKGMNLPGIELWEPAFTSRDRLCLDFALEHGVDAVSQSFVESAADVRAVREAAQARGRSPFILAKIERARAVENFDDILAAADGVMVARGDLGVEVPIQEIALFQKDLIARANLAGKPVITATQMLESMVSSRLPTRAEATDVANAVLDGTDCLMLSAESALGRFPVESVKMLAAIAAVTEPQRAVYRPAFARPPVVGPKMPLAPKFIASVVQRALETARCAAVVVPTQSGATARMISRYKPGVWVVAASRSSSVCRALAFSYGVRPVLLSEGAVAWRPFALEWVRRHHVPGAVVMVVVGPSSQLTEPAYHLEFVSTGTTPPSPGVESPP